MAKYKVSTNDWVHVSDCMTGKMTGIEALSTSALDNPICQGRCKVEGSICESCFACATLNRYKALEACSRENYRILNERLLSRGEACQVRFFTKLGRIEAFGDVGSVVQARNYLRIMRYNKQTRFAVWTKNPRLWDEAIELEGKPSNCTMVLSSFYKNVEAEDYKKFSWVDYVFTVYTADWLAANGKDESFINCGARSCLTCKRCYTKHKDGQVRFVHELVK